MSYQDPNYDYDDEGRKKNLNADGRDWQRQGDDITRRNSEKSSGGCVVLMAFLLLSGMTCLSARAALQHPRPHIAARSQALRIHRIS